MKHVDNFVVVTTMSSFSFPILAVHSLYIPDLVECSNMGHKMYVLLVLLSICVVRQGTFV